MSRHHGQLKLDRNKARPNTFLSCIARAVSGKVVTVRSDDTASLLSLFSNPGRMGKQPWQSLRLAIICLSTTHIGADALCKALRPPNRTLRVLASKGFHCELSGIQVMTAS